MNKVEKKRIKEQETIEKMIHIYCKKNQADMILPENVEVKKIPKDLLDKCNFESEVQE